MKTRDWVFAFVLIVVVALVMRPSGPQSRDGFVVRALKWAALIWGASHDGPPPVQANYEGVPLSVMNTPAERRTDADGVAVLNNADGW